MKRAGKIIVTGGAGFIGSHLISRLIDLNYKIIIIDNFSTGKLENLRGYRSKARIINADVADDKLIRKNLDKEKNIKYIYHLAALPRIERSVDSIRETHRANVDGVFNILELARSLRVNKVIFTSSSSVYGTQKENPLKEDSAANPMNPYGTQKLIGEKYCDIYSKIFQLNVVTLRLFNVYGPKMKSDGIYQLVFTKWIEQIKKGQPLTIYGDGRQTRDFTYISDVINALVLAMDFNQKKTHEVINIGSGKEVQINYLASLFNHRVKHQEPRKFEERFKQADIRKARRLLLWYPKVYIEDGVKQLLKSPELQ